MAGKRIPAPVKKICDLLREDRAEYQRAAAIILGELGLKDSYVVRALGEVLNNGDDRALKGHVLDAFEKIRARESLNYLLPFLLNNGSEGDLFTERAVAIASSLGGEAARVMKGMLRKADAKERCILNSIFIRMRNLEGLKVVLESLEDEDPEVISTICRLMKEEARHFTAQERKRFSSRIEAFLKEKKKVKSRSTMVAAIRILGYIACPDSEETLLSFTTLQNHPSVRSQALNSLKNVPLGTPTSAEVIKRLLSYLEENDFTNIVSPTMDILMRVPLQARMADWVIRLLNNPHEAVRRFAVRKMRELNSPKVVRILIDLLGDPDPAIRDLAAESLCWLDAARSIILDRIVEEEDPEMCWLFAKILRPHSAKFRSRQITRLSEHLDRLLDRKSPLQEPLLFLIRTVAPDYLQESLLSRGRKLKSKKKFQEAVQTFRIMEKNGNFSDEAKYELAVCLLKQGDGNGERREGDRRAALALFQQLLKEEGEFPLLERIEKEKLLDREDLYFLANHFIDKLKVERDFGSDLLRFLVRRHPRSKVGQASKKLLRECQAG